MRQQERLHMQERLHTVTIVRTSRTDPSDTFEGTPFDTLLSEIKRDVLRWAKEGAKNIWTFRVKDVLTEDHK